MPCDAPGCAGVRGHCDREVVLRRDDGSLEGTNLCDLLVDPPRSRGGTDKDTNE